MRRTRGRSDRGSRRRVGGERSRRRIRPFDWLLLAVPLPLVAKLAFDNELATFLLAAAAILPLAGLIGRSTEQLALRTGPRVGGLLNATFGNVTELIISIFLIGEGEIQIVKASLTGSILGNLLLVLGLSFFVGGLRYSEQHFDADTTSVHAASLMLAVIGLLMPALFVLGVAGESFLQREVVSGSVAGVLILVYAAMLVFTLVTHQRPPASDAGERPEWSKRTSLVVLLVATALVALESELLVGSLEPALESLGVSRLFLGLIVVPIIGNAAEHSSAVLFAMRDEMDGALEIAIGSSTQIALFVAPALVFISLLQGRPMDFVFTPFEIAAVGAATVIVTIIARDGRSNWLEGIQLIAAWVIMGVSFFFVGG